VVWRGTWDEPRIFSEIQKAGDVPDLEMESVFNLGVGMLAVVPREAAERAVDVVRSERHDAWIVGEIVDGHGQARVETR
jgi:phosphoribosylformylglycinamidine cyclo-ligase